MARAKPKEEKRIIPIHFQTFGDMMMNMLTLFILLCSFAKERQAEFFERGSGSFVQAIESLGFPGLLPADTNPILQDQTNDPYRTMMDREDREGEESEYDSMDKIRTEAVPDTGEAWIPGGVRFTRGSSKLSSEGKAWLHEQLDFLRGEASTIEVVGHAWNETSEDSAGYRLSLKRAYAIIEYLMDVGGISVERMHAVGCGAFRPLAEGEKDPGLNRRVNIKLAKSRYR